MWELRSGGASLYPERELSLFFIWGCKSPTGLFQSCLLWLYNFKKDKEHSYSSDRRRRTGHQNALSLDLFFSSLFLFLFLFFWVRKGGNLARENAHCIRGSQKLQSSIQVNFYMEHKIKDCEDWRGQGYDNSGRVSVTLKRFHTERERERERERGVYAKDHKEQLRSQSFSKGLHRLIWSIPEKDTEKGCFFFFFLVVYECNK
jgi:hypothetical protein